MDWKSVAETVTKLGAPILGGVLLGPAGAAAGAALAAKFGAESMEPADISQKIESDPDAQVKLLDVQKLDFEREKAYLGDKQNARDMAVQFAKSGIKNTLPAHIAYSLVGLLALSIALLFFIIFEKITVDEAILIQLGAIIGFLTAKVGSIVDFFFGSSAEKK